MTPKALLEKLKKDVSPRLQETLEAVYQTCIEQQDRGINDFSVASIAKLGQKRGVPKAQSIRNKSGERYRALILSFAESNQNKAVVRASKSDEDWIDEISSPKHKLLARILSSELRAAKQQLEELVPPKLRIDVYDHKSPAPLAKNKLSDQERRALEYLISSQFQKKWVLTANDYGALLDSNNKPVFKVATIDAIKKTLDFL